MPRISEIGNWDGQDLDGACAKAEMTVNEYLKDEEARLQREEKAIEKMISEKN